METVTGLNVELIVYLLVIAALSNSIVFSFWLSSLARKINEMEKKSSRRDG